MRFQVVAWDGGERSRRQSQEVKGGLRAPAGLHRASWVAESAMARLPGGVGSGGDATQGGVRLVSLLMMSSALLRRGGRGKPDVPGAQTPAEPASAAQTATERRQLSLKILHPLPSFLDSGSCMRLSRRSR